jgi:hypothetical protein
MENTCHVPLGNLLSQYTTWRPMLSQSEWYRRYVQATQGLVGLKRLETWLDSCYFNLSTKFNLLIIFRVVASCSILAVCWHFRETWCFRHQDSLHSWSWMQYGLLKCWHTTKILCGETTQKMSLLTFLCKLQIYIKCCSCSLLCMEHESKMKKPVKESAAKSKGSERWVCVKTL